MTVDAPYLALKLSHELYGRTPEGLDADQQRRIVHVAARQQEIERRILGSRQASLVMLPEASVAACLKDIRDRYPDQSEFETDLARNGLDVDSLRRAIERDLKVEAILELVAAAEPPVSDTEVEIFYWQHADRFRRPETRLLRHILVTVNEAVAGSRRDVALARMAAIRARLVEDIGRFAEQAIKHSECPTAMNGGWLGRIPRGKLFPQIETDAFALSAGELSRIVESPLGFHLLLCGAVSPETEVPLVEIQEKIREHLVLGRRSVAQKRWIAGLFGAG